METTERGHVKVNKRLQTTAEGVWAVGDCAGSPHFTHISEDDFAVVSDNIAGGDRVTTGRQVPFCMFTDPELARVGLSETEAKQRGIPYRLAKLPMSTVFRAMTIPETRGFMKALIDTESDRILGFTMFGAISTGKKVRTVCLSNPKLGDRTAKVPPTPSHLPCDFRLDGERWQRRHLRPRRIQKVGRQDSWAGKLTSRRSISTSRHSRHHYRNRHPAPIPLLAWRSDMPDSGGFLHRWARFAELRALVVHSRLYRLVTYRQSGYSLTGHAK